MRKPSQPPAPPGDRSGSEHGANTQSPLSLSRLREAFAAMLTPENRESRAESQPPGSPGSPSGDGHDRCEINPRSVVEAMLFVGRPDNRPLSAREMAVTMRGVSPAEIDAAVAELNALYQHDGAPYQIVGSSTGYQLLLRDEYGRMRDKFYGRVRESKLSPAAIEILSIVAYNQPTTLEEINTLRGTSSGAVLSTLVRRKLVRLERPTGSGQQPLYSTTERFLRFMGLEGLAALPRSGELEKA